MKSAYKANSAIYTFFSLKRLCAVVQQTQPPRRTRSAAAARQGAKLSQPPSSDRPTAAPLGTLIFCLLRVYMYTILFLRLFICVCRFIFSPFSSFLLNLALFRAAVALLLLARWPFAGVCYCFDVRCANKEHHQCSEIALERSRRVAEVPPTC